MTLLASYFRYAPPHAAVSGAAGWTRSAATTSGAAPQARLRGGAGSKGAVDMQEFPPERIRNISIIAHIDHGKSTLADRLLQLTGTATFGPKEAQVLDKLKVEKERGITVKAQTVSMLYKSPRDDKTYLLNILDTPGHVDFSYEVSRSLMACEGVILIVDASQGIQAQTLSVFHIARNLSLEVLPVINKIDLPHANPSGVSNQIEQSLGIPRAIHKHISAKSGLGVGAVLQGIVDELPPPITGVMDSEGHPRPEEGDKLQALVVDTYFDRFRGVISLIRLFSGRISKGDKITSLQSGKRYEVIEVGILHPEETPVDSLFAGQVGYITCNMKDPADAFVGDTICRVGQTVQPLPGSQPMQSMVFAGVFPLDSSDFAKMEESITKLTLTDRSVTVQRETSAALGQGCRLGFLGSLHLDVFRQRLEDEYSSNVIVTAPSVPYKVTYKDGSTEIISNPAEFPDSVDYTSRIAMIEEPVVTATIIANNEHVGAVMQLCSERRGTLLEHKSLEQDDRAVLRYQLPLSETVVDFYGNLKSLTSGYATFDYESAGYEAGDLIRLNLLLNGDPVDALAMIVHRSSAIKVGREWVKKLKGIVPRQLFVVAIQAAIGTKVIARESLSAMRKDVTAGLYGGHYERKMKHLEKQKRGKAKLKKLGVGNIEIPQSAFYEILSSRPTKS